MTVPAELTASKASLIRELLRDKSARESEGAFVIEGPKPIHDLTQQHADALLAVVMTPTWLERGDPAIRRALQSGHLSLYQCRDSVFERMSEVRTAQGILAVVKKPVWDQAALFKRARLFGVFGEALQDPANVGTIIRTAAAFGLDALWLSSDSADAYGPKVVRATAGALLKLPILSIADGPAVFARHHCDVMAAEPPGTESVPIRQLTSRPRRAVLAVGNESRGLSAATLQQASIRFHIPVARDVESLNVAASLAVAAFYLSGLSRDDEADPTP